MIANLLRIKARVLVLGLVAAIFAWSSAAPCHADGNQADDPIVVVTFFGEILPGLRKVVEGYTAETGRPVTVQGMPYASYEMWLRTQFLSKRPPDVVIIEDTILPWYYGQAGLLTELSEIIKQPNHYTPEPIPWADEFRQPYIQTCRDATGQLWCLPFTQYGVGFFYDRDIYDQLNLTPPSNWAELTDNFARIKLAGYDVQLTSIAITDGQTVWLSTMLEDCLMRHKIPAVNIDHTEGWRFDPLDPQTTINERIDLTERIIAFEKGIIDPAQATEYKELLRLLRLTTENWNVSLATMDNRELENAFGAGKVVHFLNGTWYLPFLDNFHKIMAEVEPQRVFNWSTFPVPQLTDRSTDLTLAGGINQNAGMRACLIIPTQPHAPNKIDPTIDFCRYLTRPDVMETVMATGGVYDIPAIERAKPLEASKPLLASLGYAYLPISSLTGYDAEAYSIFWTLWQRWFGNDISDDELLKRLSESQRQSLKRLAQRFHDDLDMKLIEKELGPGRPTWLDE